MHKICNKQFQSHKQIHSKQSSNETNENKLFAINTLAVSYEHDFCFKEEKENFWTTFIQQNPICQLTVKVWNGVKIGRRSSQLSKKRMNICRMSTKGWKGFFWSTLSRFGAYTLKNIYKENTWRIKRRASKNMWKLQKMHCCEALKELCLLSSSLIQKTSSERPESGKFNQWERFLRKRTYYLFLDLF